MLLHGNSKTNTNILDSVIKEAKNKGYELGHLMNLKSDDLDAEKKSPFLFYNRKVILSYYKIVASL